MLITFEGIDGSGKSTQISLLKEELTKRGLRVEVFREPGGTDVSEMIRGMLLNPEIEIDPITELLLFSSARSQLVAEKVLPLLEEDAVVILDRFYDSTTAYQGYGRESVPIAQIQQINETATHGLEPDITFYLRLSPKVAAERTKSFEKDRMEQSGDTFFERVYQGFEKLSQTEARFEVIDAEKDINTIHSNILNAVTEKLGKNDTD
ncbi:MAG: dTMP kinase [Balneola sp.]|nr:dTMP kinase [Balneola sp.]|tara:strand:+ start:97640 stop:98260 length:621 start_codon:yes stop_codon:yes gene_type:complete